MKLFEITDTYLQLMEMEEVDITEYLQGIQDQAEEKIIYLGRLIKQMDAEAEAIKNEEKKLSERRRPIENKIERLKSYILENMLALEIKETKDATVAIKPKLNPPSVVVDDENAIPEEYKKVIPETKTPDKNLIKDAIKSGIDVTGCHLEQKQSLSIK